VTLDLFPVYRCLGIQLSLAQLSSAQRNTLPHQTPTESTKTFTCGATQPCPPSRSTPIASPATILLHQADRLFLLSLRRCVLRNPPRPNLLVLAPPLAQALHIHNPTRLPYHRRRLNR
jgi:hypothetical protein